MDLDTFLKTVYVLVDDWYKHKGASGIGRHKASCMKMSGSDDRWLLQAHMQHYLAGYNVPRTIEFRDALPISAAGKILKRELTPQRGDSA